MRTPIVIAVVLVSAGGLAAALGDDAPDRGPVLLWDNYLSADGYDRVSYFSSERNAVIPDGWAADDAVFAGRVTVETIEWRGIRKPGYAYPAADVIILDGAFNTLHTFTDLSYESTVIAADNPLFGYEPYEGRVRIPDTNLAPGHYYFAARLVSPTAGRNMVLTTGEGVPHAGDPALTMGAVRNPAFEIYDWTLIADYQSSPVTDYTYRIHGRPVTLGDMNCDGVLDFKDIDPLVVALQGRDAYLAQFPDCNWYNGDINGDGTVNFLDIDPWVVLLSNQ